VQPDKTFVDFMLAVDRHKRKKARSEQNARAESRDYIYDFPRIFYFIYNIFHNDSPFIFCLPELLPLFGFFMQKISDDDANKLKFLQYNHVGARIARPPTKTNLFKGCYL